MVVGHSRVGGTVVPRIGMEKELLELGGALSEGGWSSNRKGTGGWIHVDRRDVRVRTKGAGGGIIFCAQPGKQLRVVRRRREESESLRG